MKKVLIVDDTKNIRTLLSTCLEIEGYEVMTAKDGLQALELFKNQRFDLAFLDIKMPEISGTEVLRNIREQNINIPVVIMTAFATVKNAVECTRLGAVAYLQKPFTSEKVKLVMKGLEEALANKTASYNMLHMIKNIENCIDQELYADAVALLKSALALEPTNAALYLLFSKAYAGLGDMENSDKFYRTSKLFNS